MKEIIIVSKTTLGLRPRPVWPDGGLNPFKKSLSRKLSDALNEKLKEKKMDYEADVDHSYDSLEDLVRNGADLVLISPYIKETSTPYLVLFSHTIGDESYAINYNEFQKNKQWDTKRAIRSNLLAFITWALSTMLGGAIGSSLALNSVVMNYLLVSMFVFMLVNQFVSKRFVFVGLLSGSLAVLFTIILHNNISIVLAAVLASCIGYLVENYQLKKTVEEGNI